MITMQLELKQKAIQLRKQGKTFSEIQQEIGRIAKSTLSGWLKKVELTEVQKTRIRNRILDRGALGRQKGGWRNHQKRLERISGIKNVAGLEFSNFMRNPLFFAGLLLYLAEGAKKIERFQFMNSDPYLIKFMIRWIKTFDKHDPRILKITARLYTHKLYAHENHERFWSQFLGIPPKHFYKTIYKPTAHKVKKNPEYKGCVRIEIGGSELFWKIMKWRDMLYASL